MNEGNGQAMYFWVFIRSIHDCSRLTEGPGKNHLARRVKRFLVWARIALWETFEAAYMLHSWLPKSSLIVPKNLTAAETAGSWDKKPKSYGDETDRKNAFSRWSLAGPSVKTLPKF